MAYWWANQSRNFADAIEEGSLWTCERPSGKKLDEGRAFIKELRVGDVVFHYSKKYIRAVSVVTKSWIDYPRSPAYEAREGESDTGWLVEVDPIHTEVQLHFKRVRELIEIGLPGPFNLGENPHQGRYLSTLSDLDGNRLLEELKVELPDTLDPGFLGHPPEFWDGIGTDAPALRKLRLEQGRLRAFLIKGRRTVPCSLCAKELPTRLLIAGHIKPRSMCTEDERRNLSAVAMLVCTLGCDALFEWGYIVIRPDGHVHRGRTSETASLEQEISSLVGLRCGAYNDATAPNFAAHVGLHT